MTSTQSKCTEESAVFAKMIGTAFDVVTLPVSVAADVVTLGGVLNDRDEPTGQTNKYRTQ